MTIEKQEPTITVTFNAQEIEFLRGITQNDLTQTGDARHEKIRMEIFVAMSRALGYNMNTDGTISRSAI